MSSDLTEEQLRALYAWLDAIPLSRPKRNISRDFSDGVLLAEVIACYFPNLVELHNYSNANSVQQKMYNFETLNVRVLKKLGFQITRATVEDLVNCRPGAVENVLNSLQFKMAKYREKKERRPDSGPMSPRSEASPARGKAGGGRDGPRDRDRDQDRDSGGGGGGGGGGNRHVSQQSAVDEEILLEKEQQIRELQETVGILELKVSKLEQLVRLKDNKIKKLMG
jgi:hypothetical protein